MGMTFSTLLLRVAAAWPVPGLGLLLLPDAEAPSALQAYPLHTALPVVVYQPDGSQLHAAATVEEVTQANTVLYGLLVAVEEADAIPAGTEIWLDSPC